MTELRRLALAAAAAIPLSLASAGIASADLGDGPWTAGTSETSVTYAGIGGAGTIHSDSGYDHHGNRWTEESAVLAGPMGAVVWHNEESDFDTNDHWNVDDKPGRPSHSHGKRPVAHTDGDEVSSTRPAKTLPVREARPVREVHPVRDTHPVREAHHGHVAYAESTKTADENGATSSHVASHAGDKHAMYEASDLSAGPDGAESEGVKAVAKPEYTSYHKWNISADEDGASTHEVSSVADVDDWNDDHDTFDRR
ncbi:hypothetical protein [Amycolatopsis sp. lyj-90]|uniref:hypothetical protein n=1 Tax=Amycolatopsis sp. lyj-90 TaxID=2789285 RepID=UPI00397D7463